MKPRDALQHVISNAHTLLKSVRAHLSPHTHLMCARTAAARGRRRRRGEGQRSVRMQPSDQTGHGRHAKKLHFSAVDRLGRHRRPIGGALDGGARRLIARRRRREFASIGAPQHEDEEAAPRPYTCQARRSIHREPPHDPPPSKCAARRAAAAFRRRDCRPLAPPLRLPTPEPTHTETSLLLQPRAFWESARKKAMQRKLARTLSEFKNALSTITPKQAPQPAQRRFSACPYLP